MKNAFSKRRRNLKNYKISIFPSRSGQIFEAAKSNLSEITSLSANETTTPTLLFAVLGLRSDLRLMELDEIRALGDGFTTQILLEGKYPLTLSELIESIESIPEPNAPFVRDMFLVSEGAQYRLSNPNFNLNDRLVFTWKRTESSPVDFMLSTTAVLDDENSLLQLIAWSEKGNAFHYFERKNGAWGWAGNSFHALRKPTRGKGPFDSHVNGSLVMKELRFPWAHWHSQSSSVPREAFPDDSQFNTEEVFSKLNNAEDFEGIVKNGIRRWTKSRINLDTTQGGLKNVHEYGRQLVSSTTANLVSSSIEYHRVSTSLINLPSEFFFDADGIEQAAFEIDFFSDPLPSSRVQIEGSLYLQAVNELMMYVESDGSGVEVEGDTHFCFLVPERAFEDNIVAQQLISRGILEPRLALALLMVDFSNPISSDRRASLLKYFPKELDSNDSLTVIFLDNLKGQPVVEESAEEEFMNYWKADDILGQVKENLKLFIEGIQNSVETLDGVIALLMLAERRKQRFRNRLLNEFESTLSKLDTQIPPVSIGKDGIIHIIDN